MKMKNCGSTTYLPSTLTHSCITHLDVGSAPRCVHIWLHSILCAHSAEMHMRVYQRRVTTARTIEKFLNVRITMRSMHVFV